VAERARPQPTRRKPSGTAPKPKPKSSPKPKSTTKRKAKQKSTATRRSGGAVRLAAASVVLVGLLFAFVYPTRTFLDQRSETQKARTQLDILHTENKRLASEAKRLQGSAEIERRARQYGLVKPGEHPFVIIPAPSTATTAAPAPAETSGSGP
jgi:cell division protein FtsB